MERSHFQTKGTAAIADGSTVGRNAEVRRGRLALDALFEIERDINQLVSRKIQRNRFWSAMVTAPRAVPKKVFIGTVIENYHFLRHEPYFDGPALTIPGNRAAQDLFNEFYCDEYGHDKMLEKALFAIQIRPEELREVVPLPETAALINTLSYWARYERNTFFATVGVLEGRERKLDSFITACVAKRMPREFVKPVRAHALINVRSEHGGLSRLLFRELGDLPSEAVQRVRRHIPLFIELYNAFYEAIWDYYSSDRKPLLRTVSRFAQ